MQDSELKSLSWEHEVLEQRFGQVQKECNELYGKFVKAIHEVEQKSGFKNLLLEKKLTALADAIEKKVMLFNINVCVKHLYTSCFTGTSS